MRIFGKETNTNRYGQVISSADDQDIQYKAEQQANGQRCILPAKQRQRVIVETGQHTKINHPKDENSDPGARNCPSFLRHAHNLPDATKKRKMSSNHTFKRS